MRTSRLFQSKENRDKAWREGGKRGRRSSIRNQQLHPQYVHDYEGPEKHETGLGNPYYKTFFPVLYELED